MLKTATDQYQDIRDAVRALCTEFPDEYHRKIDEARGYPEAFVDALTTPTRTGAKSMRSAATPRHSSTR